MTAAEPGLDALRALSNAATPGPWTENDDGNVVGAPDPADSGYAPIIVYGVEIDSENSNLMIAAVNYVRAALAVPAPVSEDGLRAAIREKHRQHVHAHRCHGRLAPPKFEKMEYLTGPGDYCEGCMEPWPCDVIALAATPPPSDAGLAALNVAAERGLDDEQRERIVRALQRAAELEMAAYSGRATVVGTWGDRIIAAFSEAGFVITPAPRGG